MRNMITPDEAREIVLNNTQVLSTETITHGAALGRVLATDVISDLELPPFDNSAMDGYAVVAADVEAAAREQPVTLRLLQTIAAGESATHAVERGTCLKIMTGAPVPEGADAVVMREETEEHDGQVFFYESAKPHQNIRPRGDDIKRGEKVLTTGTVVRAAQWAMLASLGQAQVEVFRAPRVGIITTGNELVDVDAPLQDGQIRDSNSFALEALCRSVGAEVERTRVGDDVSTLGEALREYATRCDCVITSGGVSAGDFDPVRDALLEMQESGEVEIHFWKIAMKPGKPVMHATLAQTPVFGLPGNPVSVMVSWEQFVRPALWKMLGRPQAERVVVEAEMVSEFNSPSGKVEFVRALVSQNGARWQANATGDQSSGRLSTMTRANALLVVPADVTRVEAGEKLPAQMIDWPEP